MKNETNFVIANHLTRILRAHGTVTAGEKNELKFEGKTGLSFSILFDENGPGVGNVILKHGENAYPYPVTSSSETAAAMLKSIGHLMQPKATDETARTQTQ